MAKKKTLVNVHPNGELTKLQSVGKLPRGQFKLDQPHLREDKPSISLKYVDLNFKSFDDLREGHKLKELDAFLKKCNDAPDWNHICSHYQRTPTTKKKAKQMMKTLGMDPEQMDMFHIKLTDEFRLHGFLISNRFKLVWLDPFHEIDKD